ncbi:hypothetical protein [Streptomyces blattellae]|uniref:hypothetical protein n=1 Tax=Streptomyces blattellae TaxID=2569855 RepID=UPI0012B9D725|nr:hypothetical protein [Streptomyces blattellae]
MANRAQATPGARFGRLTVVGEPTRGANSRIEVRCDCGSEKTIALRALGTTTNSCGCLGKETASARARKHGKRDTPEYRIWQGMKWRCLNPNYKPYPRYGGRGIKVCDRWIDSFEAFLADVGPRPSPKHTLDRLDNDGNYEPGNVAWRTYKEQAQNKRPQLRDTCVHGHPRTPENVRVRPDGGRTCRVCDKERQQARRDAKSAADNTTHQPKE